MGNKIIKFIFFGNYFVGLLAVALTFESILQLNLPQLSLSYYLLLFFAPIVYYTFAYHHASTDPQAVNPRNKWYFEHKKLIGLSQLVISLICLAIAVNIFVENYHHILSLPVYYWVAIGVVSMAAIFYYGLLPKSFIKLELRHRGWLKPFIIGFVWACCANVLPLVVLKIESDVSVFNVTIWAFLFIKNLMFCTVNAIIFDIKDYPTDANKQLRTFVVRYGLRKTIFNVLMPLVCVGVLSMLVFAFLEHFSTIHIFLTILPFGLTIYLAYSMHKRHKIMYYLMIIDGLILVKALCGIVGMQFY
ncbi:putative membrane protein [Pedobacter sp. UYEF25]